MTTTYNVTVFQNGRPVAGFCSSVLDRAVEYRDRYIKNYPGAFIHLRPSFINACKS